MSSNTSSPDDRAAIGITGATGFIGVSIVNAATTAGIPTVSFARSPGAASAQRQLDLNAESIDLSMFSRCRCVIHTAGRAHVIHETEPSPLAAFRRINLSGTVMIAKAAVNAGVSRFIFLSSIGVLGTATTNRPFHASLPASPVEDYARSKAEAETALSELSRLCDMEMIIVRPPLVYGPNPKGNFARLLDRVHRKQAMPVGLRSNRRSFVGVDNLASALLTMATTRSNDPCRHGARIYHIADDGVVSTRRLVEILAEGLGVSPRPVSIPRWLAVGGATLLGKGALARRLFDDLEVDDSDFRRDFGWQPHVSLEDGLRQMAAAYAREHEGRH